MSTVESLDEKRVAPERATAHARNVLENVVRRFSTICMSTREYRGDEHADRKMHGDRR